MQPLRKYGQSLLDQPIGLAGQVERDAANAEARNTAQEIKTMQRLGRRAYRQALRNDDYAGAMDALSRVSEMTGSTGSGIGVAGQLVRQLENRIASRDKLVTGMQRDVALPQEAAQLTPSGVDMSRGTPQYASGNLGQRQQLFDAMVASGGGPAGRADFRDQARNLGISDSSFDRAVARVSQFTPNREAEIAGPPASAKPAQPVGLMGYLQRSPFSGLIQSLFNY